MDQHAIPDESPETQAELLFIQEDLEFRTITTLLHIVGSREKVKLQNFTVSPDQRPYLKFLTGFSSLLVRNCEILALLPKRSGHSGTEFFLSSEADQEDEDDAASLSSASSASSTGSAALYYLTSNPRFTDPVDIPIGLTHDPELIVGSDILRVILANWHQSFDHHVKLFEHLLNLCLATPRGSDEAVWNNLKTYCVISSVQKLHRRFRQSKLIQSLRTVQMPTLEPSLPPLLGLTKVDDTNILMVLILNTNARAIHSTLFRMVTAQRPPGLERRQPDDPSLFLRVFDAFIKWLISEVSGVISHLNQLRAPPNQPESLPVRDISTLLTNLDVLRYFAWKSEVFPGYIAAMLGTGVDPVHASKLKEPEMEQEEFPEGEDQLDIATEFDSEESPTASPSNVHRCVSELRLITCNVQHLVHLQDIGPSLKRQQIRFQILKYPRSDESLKPWREVIASLFPPHTTSLIIQTLREAKNKKFNVFHPNGPALTFKGQAHCEAVLGCLYTLANGGGGDISWTNISPNLLQTLKNSYNLLAPSKRCCPVCATTISLLSTPNDTPQLQALSKHSIIFPCAFPPGLPRSVRVALLDRYRARLKRRLMILLKSKKGRVSDGSGQSEPSSLHALQQDNEGTRAERALWGIYEDELGRLEEEERRRRWNEIVDGMEVQRVSVWWDSMKDSLKIGLNPAKE